MIKIFIVIVAIVLSTLALPTQKEEAQAVAPKATIKVAQKEEPIKEATKEVTPEPSPVVEHTVAPTQVIHTGTKYDWMSAAGIPETDWDNVDSIVTRESGWNPDAVNPSSGACGLAQALPCSKTGDSWNDPVVALTWQYQYVTSRYGGYTGAVSFWNIHHWY